MTSSQAGFLAKQGLSMLYNATVTSVSAISSGIGMAYKTYTDHYEKSQIEALKKSGKPPADVIASVLQRFYYLSMAGYQNEVAAAAQKIAAKLTSGGEKSTVSYECVVSLSGVLVSTCTKYGDFSAGGWGLQDFLNSSRMGKDHFDRDQLVSDLYFGFLLAQDLAGGPGAEFERIIREAAGRMVEGDSFVGEKSSGYGSSSTYTPSAFGSASSLPSYAQVPSAFGSSSAKPASSFGSSSSSSSSNDSDPKKRAAKVLNVLASSIKKAVDEAESKRVRSLKEAEDMLQREKQKAAQSGAAPAAFGNASGFGSGSSFGSAAPAASGFGSGSGSGSGFGGAAKPTGFGSNSAFGASTGGAGSGFGSGGSGWGAGGSSAGGSGWGSGASSGVSAYGGGTAGFGNNSGGFASNTSAYSSVGSNPSAPTGYGNSSNPGQTNFLGL